MDLADFKREFDILLRSSIDTNVRAAKADAHDPFIGSIIEHACSLLLAGGKRVRPYVAELAYRTAGGKKTKEARRLFLAFEFFHLFCLVHDDVIDRGRERHGIPTTHLFLKRELARKRRAGDHAHIADGQAVLLGDLLFLWAQNAFDDGIANAFPRDKNARRLFSEMIREVIVGQMIDVDLMTRERTTTNLLRRKIELKTARYTFVRPMQIGATIAGSNKRLLSFSEKLGTALGMAFQIQDDLLDIVSHQTTLKKTILSDVQDRQHTFFTQHLFEKGTRAEQSKFRRYFGKDIPRREYSHVIKLFLSSGAIEAGTREMNRLFDQSERLIKESSMSSVYKREWRDLVTLIRARTS
ncbi:MAG: polyprenyl synthetase family protein [Patescibacteria group bacterium]|jgi:geranylgeranyl diphosphate synthase type I